MRKGFSFWWRRSQDCTLRVVVTPERGKGGVWGGEGLRQTEKVRACGREEGD